MQWDTHDWRMRRLKIRHQTHIWVPDIEHREDNSPQRRANSPILYRDIEANFRGTVSTTAGFGLQAHCEMDLNNYPDDKVRCCFGFRSKLYRDKLRFKLSEDDVQFADKFRSTWEVKDVSLSTEEDAKTLKVCLVAMRMSKTLKLELTLPMAASAVLVLLAPLFGTFTSQHFVKMFVLLLQFLCFQFLVYRTPHLGFGGVVPKLCKLCLAKTVWHEKKLTADMHRWAAMLVDCLANRAAHSVALVT